MHVFKKCKYLNIRLMHEICQYARQVSETSFSMDWFYCGRLHVSCGDMSKCPCDWSTALKLLQRALPQSDSHSWSILIHADLNGDARLSFTLRLIGWCDRKFIHTLRRDFLKSRHDSLIGDYHIKCARCQLSTLWGQTTASSCNTQRVDMVPASVAMMQ